VNDVAELLEVLRKPPNNLVVHVARERFCELYEGDFAKAPPLVHECHMSGARTTIKATAEWLSSHRLAQKTMKRE